MIPVKTLGNTTVSITRRGGHHKMAKTPKGYHECIELGGGANVYTNTEPENPAPPKGFVDSTVKRGRLQPDGSIEWYGTMEPFPPGWDDWKNTKNNRPKEEDEKMPKAREDRAKKTTQARELMATGMSVTAVAKQLGVPGSTLTYWLKDKQQTQAPEPVQAANQEPAQAPQEPAETSIPREMMTINQDFEDAVQEMERANVTTKAGESYTIDRWGPEDDEPIPYTVEQSYDLVPLKIRLISVILDHNTIQGLPDHQALELIGQIKDMEVA